MAAVEGKNPAMIAIVKRSIVPTPWSSEFEKMVSGMK